MDRIYTEGQTYTGADFSASPLPCGDYENCIFITCNFSNADLSGFQFNDCSFTGCNLSNAKLIQTAFREIQFKGCKLTGLHFDNCHDFLFAAAFDNCTLNLSSFYQKKLANTSFINCILHEVDFTASDLSKALFNSCDLSGSIFDNTILEKADFRTSYNYIINPEINHIKKAKFSISGVPGLLYQYNIEIE